MQHTYCINIQVIEALLVFANELSENVKEGRLAGCIEERRSHCYVRYRMLGKTEEA